MTKEPRQSSLKATVTSLLGLKEKAKLTEVFDEKTAPKATQAHQFVK